MLYFLLTSFVCASTPAPKPGGKPSSTALVGRKLPPVSREPTNSTQIVSIPNGLMDQVQQAFGLKLLFPTLVKQQVSSGSSSAQAASSTEDSTEDTRLQVDLTYKKLPHTDGSAAAMVIKQVCLDLAKQYALIKQTVPAQKKEASLKFNEFRDGVKQHLSELFELAYRYLHEYRAPKHNLRWWRDGLLYIERAVIGVGQIIGVGLYASSQSGAGGISCSVGSAIIGLAGELVASHWRKQEEAYFKMRDELDGKISTLLSFYSQPETADVLKLLQTIIVDVLGYSDPAIMKEKLKKSWHYMHSYFPKPTSTTAVNMLTVAASATTGKEPDD